MPKCLLAIVVGFGTAAWGQPAQTPSAGQPRGADLRVDLNLTFAEAVWGTTKDVKVARDVPCSTCGGNGARSGMRSEISTLSVTVPAGVDDDQSLRLAGKGEAAPGGPTGDLYVVLHVQRDNRFTRNGEDVLTEVPISFLKATLGGEVEVNTLDDYCKGSATIELKPGVQPDEVIVRRGQGIPRVGEPGRRGDHVLQFKVEIPKKLTARQEKLMRELAGEFGEAVRPEKRGLSSRKK